jgi:hypothetical protein
MRHPAILKTWAFGRSLEGFEERKAPNKEKTVAQFGMRNYKKIRRNALRRWNERDIRERLLSRSIDDVDFGRKDCPWTGDQSSGFNLRNADCNFGPHTPCKEAPFWIKICGTSRRVCGHVDEAPLADLFVQSDTNFDGRVSPQELEHLVVDTPGHWQELWSSLCMVIDLPFDQDIGRFLRVHKQRHWESSGGALADVHVIAFCAGQ